MKKTVLLIAFCLFFSIVKADEFPYVKYILSKNSTVWVLVSSVFDDVTYRIEFDRFGKITWKEETDTVLCNNMKREHDDSWKDEKRWNSFDKDGYLWKIEGSLLCCMSKYGNKEKIAYQLPLSDGVLHIGDDGKVWWGKYCFIGYYQECPNRGYQNYFAGEGIRIFFIDEYAMQGTGIYLCKEGEDCPEEDPEPKPEDYENEEDYHAAWLEYDEMIGGDGYPASICFCDGRKIGYIKDAYGFVNFRTAPGISAPIIGIILDKVRVFYWDDEDNPDWYRIEINEVTGYVLKNNIISNLLSQ
jgi:hypothetical protein